MPRNTDLKDEIFKVMEKSGTRMSRQDLYDIPSIKALVTPKPGREELEIREIKRNCNDLVEEGKLTDLKAAVQGQGSGPYIISGEPIPTDEDMGMRSATYEKKERKPRKPYPTKIGATKIKPSLKLIDPTIITPDYIEIIYNDFISTSESKEELRTKLFNDNKDIERIIKEIINHNGISDSSENANIIMRKIIEFMSDAFSDDKIIVAVQHSYPSVNNLPEAIELIRGTSINVRRDTYDHLLIDSSFPVTTINQGVAEYTIGKLVGEAIVSDREPISAPLPKKDKTSLKESLESLPIDDRILVSPDIIEKINNGEETNAIKELIYEARRIIPHLDNLSQHLQESNDHELIPIANVFLEKNALPVFLWNRVMLHKETGTSVEIPKDKVEIYLQLKLLINRIDQINPEDRDTLVKIFLTMGEDPKLVISPQIKSLINMYYTKLKSASVSYPDRNRIESKFKLLEKASLSESQQRIIANLRSVYEANKFQNANEIILNAVIHDIKPTSSEIDFGKSKYSDIKLITPKSRIEIIASGITIKKSTEIANTVSELLLLSESQIEEIYSDFESGKETGVDEALIYLYHCNLIDPIVYNLIKKKLHLYYWSHNR